MAIAQLAKGLSSMLSALRWLPEHINEVWKCMSAFPVLRIRSLKESLVTQ